MLTHFCYSKQEKEKEVYRRGTPKVAIIQRKDTPREDTPREAMCDTNRNTDLGIKKVAATCRWEVRASFSFHVASWIEHTSTCIRIRIHNIHKSSVTIVCLIPNSKFISSRKPKKQRRSE